MEFTHLFAGIRVADRGAFGWYERFFGRPADRHPHDDEVVWQLTDSGLVYVVVDRPRAGNALVMIFIDDIDAAVAALAERGIAAGDVTVVGNGVRSVPVIDPDGNRIAFGQMPTDV